MMVERYKKALGPMLDHYEPKAIYHSELATFCEEVFVHSCDTIIESGTFMGYTAIRLAKVFPEKKIITVEIDKGRYKEAFKRCASYDNIICHCGQLKDFMYMMNKNCAVLIDGPKGKQAIKLARKCRKKASMVAIHDMRDFIEDLDGKFDHYVHTGYPNERYRSLDKAVPYKESHHQKGLYGKVLAIIP